MTDDELIAIRDSHLPSQGEAFDFLAFGRAVAAAEREACAKLFDIPAVISGESEEWSREAAAAIRARSTHPQGVEKP